MYIGQDNGGNPPLSITKENTKTQYYAYVKQIISNTQKSAHFNLDNYPFFTPINNKDNNMEDIRLRRIKNQLEGRRLNHGMPITLDEINLIVEMSYLGKNS